MAGMIVPPGGFAGLAQMTTASRAAWGTRGTGTTRRRTKRKSAKRAKRRTAKAKATARKPKFGTAAFRAKYGNGKRKRAKKR